jgi:hypothetical protein
MRDPAKAAIRAARALARNRAFIAEVNARTVCAHCGAQPVEWHNPEHVELNRQSFRIGKMVARCRSIQSIQEELTRCIPLCRRCHMKEDGRLTTFVSCSPSRTVCRNGHPYDDENAYRTPAGWRACRSCKRNRDRLYGERRRAAVQKVAS